MTVANAIVESTIALVGYPNQSINATIAIA